MKISETIEYLFICDGYETIEALVLGEHIEAHVDVPFVALCDTSSVCILSVLFQQGNSRSVLANWQGISKGNFHQHDPRQIRVVQTRRGW
jgi:hypothetical protein